MQTKMNGKLNELEQYSRRNNIRINGVEEDPNETSAQTTDKVVEVIQRHFRDVTLEKEDIDIAHRLGEKKDGKRQIIVKLISRSKKNEIFRDKKRDLTDIGIFINEDLTKLNQHALLCVKKKLPDEVDSAWTRDGQVKYKNMMGNIHALKFEDYQTWFDLPWPLPKPN